jgi:putative ABC transport system permease protein
MKYTTIEQLLADDGFLAWYRQTDPEQVKTWNEWIAASDTNSLLAKEAVQLLGYFQPEVQPDSKQADAIWKKIDARIRQPKAKNRWTPAPLPSGRVFLLPSYIKMALRSLRRGKMHTIINVVGLSVGMAVTILIALWIWDELSYNKTHENYARIARVWEHYTDKSGNGFAGQTTPMPLADVLRRDYPGDFTYVVRGSWPGGHTLANGDNKFTQLGNFMDPGAPDMLTLPMLKGTRSGLKEPNAILLSQTTAQKLFGDKDPIGQFVKMDNNKTMVLKVTGVYKDFPRNDEFRDLTFICPWQLFINSWDWVKNMNLSWDWQSMYILVQLAPHADLKTTSAKISDVLMHKHAPKEGVAQLFLHPMSKWHLYSEFNNGVNTGGLITFVWLFGTIGAFVLLLASINFMNLSTARSEKRAREVGIRKVMGSVRGQLIQQFFSEAILVVCISFILCLLLVQLSLPWFNDLSGKALEMPWTNGWFWLAGIVFTLLTGLISGSYPALFLSSFQPIKVLKGTFRLGRFAAAPRKILMVFQFTISVLLINGTIIVFKQIQYAKDRPVGYERAGLVSLQMTTPEVYINYNVIYNEVLRSGAAVEMAETQCPVTDIWTGTDNVAWRGKRAGQQVGFASIWARQEYGRTLGWHVKQGRDFSKEFKTDTDAIILNETAVKTMGLQHPVGEVIKENGTSFTVIGVVADMIMANPYENIPPTTYSLLREGGNFINIRLNPALGSGASIKTIEAIFKKYNPGAPFEYTLADQEYAKKFAEEERIGKLALVFALLAIFISGLGLFGLASFVAEQRTKEIGIRKVLGASLLHIWQMITKDFVFLICISLVIATPIALYAMGKWLAHYTYRTGLPWWIFAGAGLGALLLTLLTVSYQSIKAALINPVKSLRSE